MTATIALASRDGSVVLGSDSYYGDEAYRDSIATPKVVVVGSLAIGFAGSVRPWTVFLAAARGFVERRKKLTERDITERLPSHLLKRMQAEGLMSEAKLDGEYIIAHGGSIYCIEEDLGIARIGRHFSAMGAGGPIAAAAIAALAPTPPKDARAAERIVRRALGVAKMLTSCVDEPFVTVVVDKGA